MIVRHQAPPRGRFQIRRPLPPRPQCRDCKCHRRSRRIRIRIRCKLTATCGLVLNSTELSMYGFSAIRMRVAAYRTLTFERCSSGRATRLSISSVVTLKTGRAAASSRRRSHDHRRWWRWNSSDRGRLGGEHIHATGNPPNRDGHDIAKSLQINADISKLISSWHAARRLPSNLGAQTQRSKRMADG